MEYRIKKLGKLKHLKLDAFRIFKKRISQNFPDDYSDIEIYELYLTILDLGLSQEFDNRLKVILDDIFEGNIYEEITNDEYIVTPGDLEPLSVPETLDSYVSFQVAKTLKKIGFILPTFNFYDYNGFMQDIGERIAHLVDYDSNDQIAYINNYYNWNSQDYDDDKYFAFYNTNNILIHEFFTICCSAPRQEIVNKWLMKKYKYFINIVPYNTKYQFRILGENSEVLVTSNVYDTVEIANENAINSVLKKILKNEKVS